MKNDEPLVSIVMINYNGADYLRRSVPSLLKLKYRKKEILIVDNKSTDESVEVINSFGKNVSVVLNPRTRAKNYGANLGIRIAKGEYILLLDNDVILQQADLIEDLLKMYAEKEQVGCIGLSFVDEGQQTSKSYGDPMGYYYIAESKELPLKEIKKMRGKLIAFPEGKGLFIKRDLWLNIGGYDEFITFGGDDSDLGLRLWVLGYKNYLFSKSIQFHIGIGERQDNSKYVVKLGDIIYGHYLSIVKNYSFWNMIITLVGFTGFAIVKTVKQTVQRRHWMTLTAYPRGLFLFIKALPYVIRRRHEIQSRRVIKRDEFLYL